MRSDSLAHTSNVVRFPVERRVRPTLDLLRDLAPDVRQVLQLAEAFDLSLPDPGLRNAVDRDMAEHILNHVRAEPGPARRHELEALLASVVTPAVEACRVAHDAARAAEEAQQRLTAARAERGFWLAPLEERADSLRREAAARLVEAYRRTEETEGAARAIGLALRGEPWAPFDLQAEAEALFATAPQAPPRAS
jgi:hypothetical protein